MEKSKSILIVDDHPVVLVGLRALILQDGVYKNVQTASSLLSARDIINRENIDTAIIDLELSNENGLLLVKLLHHKHPKTKIIVYTMHEEIWTIRQLMDEDVDAIVLKGDDPQELLTALHRIEEGKGYYSQQFFRLINRSHYYYIVLFYFCKLTRLGIDDITMQIDILWYKRVGTDGILCK